MNDIKYSVIIPCYNSEKTIEMTVNSIVNNSYYQDIKDKLEIIAIDDGSNDDTSVILHELCERIDSIKVIGQDNQGAGAARKLGVNAAKGEYLIFVDSDDALHFNAFAVFETITNRYPDADIIRFQSTNFIEDNEITSDEIALDVEALDRQSIIDRIFINEIVDGTVSVTLWGKLYKRELFLKAVKEYGSCILEDYYINAQFYMNTNSCVEIKNSLYWYRESFTGISHKYHVGTPEMIDTVDTYKRVCINELGIADEIQLRRANEWLLKFSMAILFPLQSMPRKMRKNEYKKIDLLLKRNKAYEQAGNVGNKKEQMLLKTRCFVLIDLYFKLRWIKRRK